MRLSRPASVWGFVLLAALGLALHRTGWIDEILSYRREIAHLSLQHAVLVLLSGGPAVIVGVLVGILLGRDAMRRVAEPIMQVLNVGATIPTLAIIALSMTFLGIGRPPALFALFLHALLPIVRNTYQGIRSVPRHLIEAARGMGMTPRQMLWCVELPNSLFVIMTGIRVALVINVGVAPLAFLVGGGGLGDLIFSGIDLFEPAMMLAGAIPTVMFAVFADAALSRLTALVVPRGVVARSRDCW